MSNHRVFHALVLLLLIMGMATLAFAQDDPQMLPDPQPVELAAADGLALAGSYYALPDVPRPTLLLLHELNASRASWAEVIEPLWRDSYNLLLVDLRGHGETGGAQDWEAAVGDVQTWLAWLGEQPEVQASGITLIGADVGGNLAAIACEQDTLCLTAIAVSPVGLGCAERDCSAELPGMDEAAVAYLDETTTQVLTGEARRSTILLLASAGDAASTASIRRIGASIAEQVELFVAPRGGHGTALLSARRSPALDTALQWLGARTPPNLTPTEIEALVAAGDPANGELLFAEGLPDVLTAEGHPCSNCHVLETEGLTGFGPGLLNIGARAATRVEGQSAAVYLYTSIVAPDLYLVALEGHAGFTRGEMPWHYDRVYTEAQLADLVAYLLTLD